MTKKHKEREMSKFKLPLILVIMTAISMPAMAGEKAVKRVPAGAVAFHFVFDLSYVPVEPGPPEFVGYIAFIEGVDGDLFDGPPSKDNAYFTVRVSRPLPPPIPLPVEPDPFPGLNVSVIPPGGQFTVFFDSSPGPRDWTRPATFSEGIPIAVFEESALLSTGASGGSFPGVFYNVFSSRLIDSTRIKFNGQRIDFGILVPNGVTATNFGNGLRPDMSGASGGGTAIAIGGKLRDKSDHD
jgi:hypothetical protein